MNKTMRVEINTPLYNQVIKCVEHGREWHLEGVAYNITGATRIDCTDYIRVELKQVATK